MLIKKQAPYLTLLPFLPPPCVWMNPKRFIIWWPYFLLQHQKQKSRFQARYDGAISIEYRQSSSAAAQIATILQHSKPVGASTAIYSEPGSLGCSQQGQYYSAQSPVPLMQTSGPPVIMPGHVMTFTQPAPLSSYPPPQAIQTQQHHTLPLNQGFVGASSAIPQPISPSTNSAFTIPNQQQQGGGYIHQPAYAQQPPLQWGGTQLPSAQPGFQFAPTS